MSTLQAVIGIALGLFGALLFVMAIESIDFLVWKHKRRKALMKACLYCDSISARHASKMLTELDSLKIKLSFAPIEWIKRRFSS